MIEIDIPISRHIWWTQNRRSRTWVTPYQRKKTVKRIAHLIFLDHINRNGGKRPADTETDWPVHVTAIIHPLTHGRFDPENAAPMVKAILDAGTQAGMWPDDNAEYIIGPDYRPGTPSPDKTTYRIAIRIEQADHR